MKAVITDLLGIALKKLKVPVDNNQIASMIEIPPNTEMGDYAFPCFFLSKILKSDPHEIALQIREKMSDFPVTDFEDIKVNGPYVNFFVNRKSIALQLISEVLSKKEKYGSSNIGKGKKVVSEFSSPNIAKAFGIGHLRSTIIGNSISNISGFQGFKVVKINYLGDWGTPFGKIITGFKKYGNEKKLKANPIKTLLYYYVKVSQSKSPSLEKQSKEWFRKLELGDKEAVKLWVRFRKLSIEDFKGIYKMLNVSFDVYSGESFYNKKMDPVISELKSDNLLKESDGAWIVDLKSYGLGVVLIKKSDGATLYATRDLAAAIDRYKKYKFNKMFYEVGSEQKFYFQQLFKVLELMGYPFAKNCVHVPHGLYLDSDGKKFATRKGKTLFMEDIFNETKNLVEKELVSRQEKKKISKSEIEKRALVITRAAIIYGDLKNYRENNMVFDLNRFISFEGDTGPYLMYSYARASSILRKVKTRVSKFETGDLEDKEIELVKKLSQFPETVLSAYNNLNPALVANYSYQLAQIFNEFYHACPVIGSEEKEPFRLALVQSFRQVLKNALGLLGIETLEEM